MEAHEQVPKRTQKKKFRVESENEDVHVFKGAMIKTMEFLGAVQFR